METVRLDREIFQTTAPNGLVVLSERVPSVRSAALGVWVRTASAHESAPTMGVSHLVEHMVFKGTERRTAQEIALALEARGGSLDAYTSRDTTAFQARVLDADLPRALDVLTDLVRHPLLRPSDLELERNVVLEEINTVLDTPDDLVFDLSARQLWPSHPYGYSILGTRESVSALAAADLKRLHERAYFPGNCVFAAAGNLTTSGSSSSWRSRGGSTGKGEEGRGKGPHPLPRPYRRSGAARPGTRRRRPRPTSCSRPTRSPTSTGASTPSWSSPTCSAVGCPRGCSSASARSWGSPTRSTPSPASIARWAWRGCTWARSRRRPPRPPPRSARSTASSRASRSWVRRSRTRSSRRRAS